MSKLKTGQRVFIKELNAFGRVVDGPVIHQGGAVTQTQRIQVSVPTSANSASPGQPRYIEIADKSYTIVSGVAKILFLILQFLRSR